MLFLKRTITSCGLALPCLGFGGAPLGGLFAAVDKADGQATLNAALNAGMRYVDTAPYYGFGKSERHVGDCLRGRDAVLSTKAGRLLRPGPVPDPSVFGWPDALPFTPIFDYSYDGIMRSLDDSLQRLGLDHIDILYVHDIDNFTHGADNIRHLNALRQGGYRAMRALRDTGVVRAIGIGVNDVQTCLTALDIGAWDVFLLAGRYTLLEQTPLDDLLPKCVATDTSIVIGGAFNSGVLVGGDTFNYGAVPDATRAKVTAMQQVCREFDVALPAAALQFPLGHEMVVSVLPGLRSMDELHATLDWVQADIPAAFWGALKSQGLLHGAAPVPARNPYLVAPDALDTPA